MISRIAQDFFGEQIPEPKNPEPEIQDTYSEIPPEPESLLAKIERLLADGPKPYGEILEAVGGNEDALRDAIRGWKELIALTDKDGVFMWEIVKDPVSISERVAIKYENETPEDLGKPVFWYKGVPLAWENDTAETKVYAWCLTDLFPGRPLSVDPEPVGRLLNLSPREVREALARLVKDGDLVRTWEKGRELYRLIVRYQ